MRRGTSRSSSLPGCLRIKISLIYLSRLVVRPPRQSFQLPNNGMIGRVSAIAHIVPRLCLVLLDDTPRVSGAELFELKQRDPRFVNVDAGRCLANAASKDTATNDHQVAPTPSQRDHHQHCITFVLCTALFELASLLHFWT